MRCMCPHGRGSSSLLARTMIIEKTEFIVETYNEYIARVLDDLRSEKLVSVKISTMNLFARKNTMMHDFMSAMSAANRKSPSNFLVYYDDAYAKRMLVMPDGHYVFQHSPWDLSKGKHKIVSRKIHAQNLQDFADTLIDLPQRFYQIETEAGLWAKLRSTHLLQRLAASHIKASVTYAKDGSSETAIQTGEISSASRQNNLSLSIIGNDKAAKFVEGIINPKTKIGARYFDTKQIAPNIKLVADYGNYGSPKMISYIHQLAETMINPTECDYKPTNILLISQYVPSGHILKALRLAANPKHHGARVVVPLEPDNDYRRKEIGFKILDKNFQLHRGKHVLVPIRPVPSHSKCLVVAYDDGRLSMIFGSDNFDSTSDSFYRNTELSIHIDRVKKGGNGYDMITSMLKKLVDEQEISQSEYDHIVKQ